MRIFKIFLFIFFIPFAVVAQEVADSANQKINSESAILQKMLEKQIEAKGEVQNKLKIANARIDSLQKQVENLKTRLTEANSEAAKVVVLSAQLDSLNTRAALVPTLESSIDSLCVRYAGTFLAQAYEKNRVERAIRFFDRCADKAYRDKYMVVRDLLVSYPGDMDELLQVLKTAGSDRMRFSVMHRDEYLGRTLSAIDGTKAYSRDTGSTYNYFLRYVAGQAHDRVRKMQASTSGTPDFTDLIALLKSKI